MDPYLKYPNYKPLNKMNTHDNIPQWIVVHHSASEVDNFVSIQRYHITDPTHLWENVGYHAVIDRDGTLHEGRPDFYHGAHVAEQNINHTSLGVCLCGYFDTHAPSPAQVDTLKAYLEAKTALYGIPVAKIVPHRHFAVDAHGKPYKSCYGSFLNDVWAQSLVQPEELVDIKVPKRFVEKVLAFMRTLGILV